MINGQTNFYLKYGLLKNIKKAAQAGEGIIYFATDTKQIYLDTELYTGVLEVGALPTEGVEGKLYFGDNKLAYWSGSKFETIAKSASSLDEELNAIRTRVTDLENTVVKNITVNGQDATVEDNYANVKITSADIEYKAKVEAVGTEGETGYVPGEAAVSVKEALDVINGDASTEGSIKKAAADAVATVVANAPENLDTLKEIAEWIASEETADEAADLVTRMNAAETAIGKHTVEIGGENTDVLYPVADQISDAINALSGAKEGEDDGIKVKVTTAGGEVASVTVTADLKADTIEYKAAVEGHAAVSVEGAISSLETAVETLANKASEDAAEAKTVVNVKTDGHVTVAVENDANDGHNIVTISENDIASEAAMRGMIGEATGDEMAFANTNYLNDVKTIKAALLALDAKVQDGNVWYCVDPVEPQS